MRELDLYVNAYDRRLTGKGVFFYWTVLAGFFLAVVLVSYALTPASHASVITRIIHSQAFMGQFQPILALKPVWMMLAIWAKNMVVALLLLLIGGYLGGVASYVVIGFNAALVGILVKILHVSGDSFGYLLAGLLPHGVIELPAIFLAGAVAIWAVRCRMSLGWRLTRGLRWVAPLLLVAAAVETFVTPHVMVHFH